MWKNNIDIAISIQHSTLTLKTETQLCFSTLLTAERLSPITNNRLSCPVSGQVRSEKLIFSAEWSCILSARAGRGPGWLGREVGVTTLADPR